MDRRALIRLRVAFLLLAAALLLPLGLLLRSVNARLEAQRKLRHELVAERIFDEMERELTSLLAHENARPSAAYADTGTRVENWAPFVVGYFTRDAQRTQIIAKQQLAPERVERLEAALSISKGSLRPAAAGTSQTAPSAPQSQGRRDGVGGLAVPASSSAAAPRGAAQALEPAFDDDLRKSVEPVPAAAPAPAAVQRLGTGSRPRSSPTKAVPEDVLMQLNRAGEAREEERQRARMPLKRNAASSAEAAETPAKDDPLRGF